MFHEKPLNSSGYQETFLKHDPIWGYPVQNETSIKVCQPAGGRRFGGIARAAVCANDIAGAGYVPLDTRCPCRMSTAGAARLRTCLPTQPNVGHVRMFVTTGSYPVEQHQFGGVAAKGRISLEYIFFFI